MLTDGNASQQQRRPGGQAADAHKELLGAIAGVTQVGQANLAAQIEQGVLFALNVAHGEFGVIRLRIDVDHQLNLLSLRRSLPRCYRGLLRAHRGHNELDVTAVVLAGHHGHLVDVGGRDAVEPAGVWLEFSPVEHQRALARLPLDLVAQGLGAIRIDEARLHIEGNATAVFAGVVMLAGVTCIPHRLVGHAAYRDGQITGDCSRGIPLGHPHLQLHQEVQRLALVAPDRPVGIRHKGHPLGAVVHVIAGHHGSGRQ